MIHLLADNPLLLLFVVAAIGVLVGRLQVGGVGLGVAAVLFVGLGVGAIDPSLKLPELVYVLGLVLFVYTVGLGSADGFFASLRKRGLRDNAFSFGIVLVGAGLAVLARIVLHLRATQAAGIFAGATTNTPALAGVLQYLGGVTPVAQREAVLAEPVVAYSVTYPIGVLGVLGAIAIGRRIWRDEPASERPSMHTGEPLENLTVRVTRGDVANETAEQLRQRHGLRVSFGRMRRDGVLSVVADDTRFREGDLVSVVGCRADLRSAAAMMGEATDERLDLDRRVIDYRRMFVSRPEVTGIALGELGLRQRFEARLTRLRRGDVELLPDAATELELGDRVRVVAPRDRMEAVTKFLGDSYRALSEIDVLTFGIGIAAGLLLGAIPIPVPGGGGAVFRLGQAGGPLVAGLVLGRLARTGPLVWTLPYSANLTLRQLGLVLFLAGVGTRSGWAFVETLRQGGALGMLACGAVITLGCSLLALFVGRKVLKIPSGVLFGMLAGTQTQPAALAFAVDQTKNEQPNVGYATVYPLATIAKILLAQLIIAFS